jgi:hypothetical protein
MTMMQMSARAGMTHMPGMPLISGAMFSGDEGTAKAVGWFVHIVVMGTLVFGTVYGLLFAALGSAAWYTGALIGLAHGLVVGLMAMPMMPAMHPRMVAAGQHPELDAEHTVTHGPDGGLLLAAPGVLGRAWGGMTPMGMLVGHVVFGVVLALVYSWLV